MRALGARSVLLTAACCGAAFAGLPAARAASGVLLRYHFVQGQQIPYQLTVGLTGSIPGLAPKLALSVKAAYTQAVKTVYPDGSALVVDTFTSATVTMNGQRTLVPLTGATASERVTPEGVGTGAKVTGLQSVAGGLLSINPASGAPILPLSPVTVGSHWTANQRISLGSFGAIAGAQHYRVLALRPSDGHTVATIQAKGSLPLNVGQGATQATGTAAGVDDILFDVDGGQLVSSHAATKVTASFGGGAGGQSAPVTLHLQLDIDRQS